MPELKIRSLGTPREKAPVTWVVHKTGSLLIGEFFNGGYYRECLRMAKAMASQHRPILTAMQAVRKSNTIDLEGVIANLEDVSRWAGEVQSEGYHTVNTHVFITLWAAQEAGLENVISEIIRTSDCAAKIASEKFQNGKYSLTDWPWSESTCQEISQKLEKKAIKATVDGTVNIAGRTITLFSWFGLNIEVDDEKARKYNEASMVRNVILHRYGQLAPHDVKDFPELVEWVGKVLPITTERIKSYYDAVIAMHLSMAKAVVSSQYK